jgi:antitoxin component of MazEF toxin-antitoxin module
MNVTGNKEDISMQELPIKEEDLVAEIKKTKRKVQPTVDLNQSEDVQVNLSNKEITKIDSVGKRKKETLEEISMKAPEDLSLTSAVKRKRNKK